MAASAWRSEPLTSSFVPAHDIFLSHSGAQKPFVEALYQLLRTRYSTFFDITAHSLPLGEDFPSRIFRAAQTCRLAVVVLSEEYVQSKWPMIELCAFVAAAPPPKILPLFFKLAPDDLKKKDNQERWRHAWKHIAEKDPTRVDVSKWEFAFRKLSRYNGIPLKQSEEENTYIERIFLRICENVPPSMRHDFSGVPGIHRLSEIVLAKFEELEIDQCRVCVLGMYGPPGSGKSTICRYLRDYLFSQFAGKVLYLELPTDANDEELIVKAKELLKQLTNFNNKMDLSNISNFREVVHLLRGTDFLNSRVFLVVDNISSQASGNVVKALLRLGPTVGSKVLLVARSINVLHPLLQEDGTQQNSHSVYGNMSVPGLNKEEALRVLLQSGGGVGLADSYAPEAALTPRYRQIMEEVISMSSFRGEHGSIIHLPLVLKAIGEQLRQQKLDIEKWNTKMKSFWIKVGLCKEEALQQLVLKSFRTLPRKLQTLFLDVALFVLPLSYLDGQSHLQEEVCLHLSPIHGCKPEEIEFEMQKLQKHGFLTIWEDGFWTPTISVHDVYLEFAASIEEASKYYWSSGLRWSKIQHDEALEVAGTTELGLRTGVLEVDEGREHFEFCSEFSSVKAMVLRNCKSVKTLRGLANLTFLVSLEIRNCPSLKWVEPPATGRKQPYLQRFRWANQENKGLNVKMLQQQELEVLSSKKPLWNVFWEFLPRIGFMRPVMEVSSLILQMKGLQVLRLENTGIRQSVDINGCLPQLRVLEVRECHMKHFRVCNLPNLECFLFLGGWKLPNLECFPTFNRITNMDDMLFEDNPFVSLVPRKGHMTRAKDFLAGCPKLQDVYVQCVELQGITIASSHLRHLRVNHLCNVLRLPDLSASAESLEQVMFCECRDLKSFNFGSTTYIKLLDLCLQYCLNVTEVTGLDALPNLHRFRILGCTRLKIVSGLGDLVSLKEFEVGLGCAKLERCLLPDLESMTELRSICYYGPMDGTFNVAKLVNLVKLDLGWSRDCMLIGLERLECLEDLSFETASYDTESSGEVDFAKLVGVAVPSQLSSFRWSIQELSIEGLRDLTCLNGIQFLDSLNSLWLWRLQNLSCLQGIQYLRELYHLDLWDCASIEEMPSLSAFVKLQWLSCCDCIKLRSVEGCGGLEQLLTVKFIGCKNLASCPLDLKNWKSSVSELRIEGSKFASVEALVEWAEDKEVPQLLRVASLDALWCELSESSSNRKIVMEMLVNRVVLKALERDYDNDDNYDEEVFTSLSLHAKDYQEDAMYGVALAKDIFNSRMLEEGLCCFARLPKQRLIHQCHSDIYFPLVLLYLFKYVCKVT